jgi:hypothetical protein
MFFSVKSAMAFQVRANVWLGFGNRNLLINHHILSPRWKTITVPRTATTPPHSPDDQALRKHRSW